MKAEMESENLAFRGVQLKSETKEEKLMLLHLWHHNARLVMMGRERDGNVHVVIAPTPEKKEDDNGKRS